MSFIDIIILLLLALGAWRGYKNGFIYEIAVLGAWFIALFAAFHFASMLQPSVADWFHVKPAKAHWISFALLFLIVVVGVLLLAKFFTGLISITPLGVFNKILGVMFSVFKTALLIGIVLYFFIPFNQKFRLINAKSIQESKLAQPLMKMSSAIFPLLDKANFSELKELIPAKKDSE